MKTWKIITITLAAVLVVSVPTVAVLAYINWNMAPQTQYESYIGPSTIPDSTYQTSPQMGNPQMSHNNDYVIEPNIADESPEQVPPKAPQ
ncbi:MAG: hypothetical protein P8Y18_10950, partial [Candidatus Bathyarchaeota archaeon]